MIVFDLKCNSAGHVFEAWFGSSEDYEAQRSRGLVQCPFCADPDVEKAVMAPHVGAKGNQVAASDSRSVVSSKRTSRSMSLCRLGILRQQRIASARLCA